MSAQCQLREFKDQQKDGAGVATLSSGAPVAEISSVQTVGKCGPMLLQDVNYIDEVAHFDRERIPERVVHAKGAGAFGYFQVTHDITKYCAAKLFDTVGKRTPIAVRFSTVARESGSSDTVRDLRGFAVKFYTEDGNWDIVGNNSPIFFIRDPILFPPLMHTRRNPQTHLKDASAFWDFNTLRPETTHQLMHMFGDRGIPNGYRFMHGYGSHTFKLVNCKGEAVYCKFHYKSAQGVQNLDVETANYLQYYDTDYAIRDLYDAIARGDYPAYNMSIQVMTFEEAENCKWNPFDLTKVWPQKMFPLIPVGRLVFDRNPTNYFAEVEQMALSPANMVPGIEPSPDKMLQGRLFSYGDTQRHRLGANFMQLPVNAPKGVCVKNYHRDGPMHFNDNQKGAPNYYPNSYGGPEPSQRARDLQGPYKVTGDVHRYDSGDEDNFSQAAVFWNKILDDAAKKRLVINMAMHVVNAEEFIQERVINMFAQVSPDLGECLRAELNLRKPAKM
ncbi:unnamed protein product [Chironomus riparius]|uniref:Catalase n=1 Tax=Chironomus riparius TaxID=315576 RepID=G3JV38_9DIPT|nr:unnamed protein product [Chironomus riparius]